MSSEFGKRWQVVGVEYVQPLWYLGDGGMRGEGETSNELGVS
ncbi:hypothetical protein [Cyanobacterium aponinum]|uniref:Uncharacterized protein n=1 Tax=Cyanobacterium aponinum AL20115 TaxID=3090662 RepID=A0AAF0ZDH9_9CHRO|nr:hypothetical protein [Cyanobacterium aponinum]WPF89898.1 hypothetical protein SAY89_06420 [Cyanobacterium aponinum AL20115]